MLVLANDQDDGGIVRGLSAGCPEQDIAMRAREAMQAGAARVLRYDRDHNGDVLIEMGCAGELEVLIEPFASARDWRFAVSVEAVLQSRRSGVLATWYTHDGRTLAKPAHWLWSDGEVLVDEILLDAITSPLTVAARDLPARHKPSVLALQTEAGTVEVLLERLEPPNAAWIFGVNAGSLALARLLGSLGWQATVIDHREVASESSELLGGVQRRWCPTESAAAELPLDARSFAVVMTHNLERDIAYVQAIRSAPLAYIGAVGARRRAAKLFEATGLDASRLHAPCGLDIGSETPEEIALAIAAEMLSVANGTGGRALSTIDVPIQR
jgi:xanthine/CO dehydrogenase XdhC/CoxF family maturation factor